MTPEALELQISRLAALDDPVRRSLYFYVVHQQREVGRDEAARAAGVSRTLAGFHLDRLAEEGLLETSFRRLSGRAGPGAGRPAKLYRRSDRQLEVSLPRREYEFAARILATAIDASGAPATRHALKKTARRIGQQIGAEARTRAGARPSRKRLLAGTAAVLAAQGYEPEQGPGELRLRNCPFHALVSEHKDLVCGMNLALIEGVVDGVDLPGASAVLAPAPGRCCVSLKLKSR
jgi:predicted ArsR family transcriptional regulator